VISEVSKEVVFRWS